MGKYNYKFIDRLFVVLKIYYIYVGWNFSKFSSQNWFW